MSIRPLFVGNWKMNKLRADAQSYCDKFCELLSSGPELDADIWLSVPLTCLDTVKDALAGYSGKNSDRLAVGVQNVHWLEKGAHTAEVSAQMLSDAGARFSLIGHSERRQYYGEDDEHVALRAKAAIDNGLAAVVCVGETEEQYRAGKTEQVVKQSLRTSLSSLSAEDCKLLNIAYEPVWAIGTGLAATPEIARDVHRLIRAELQELYADSGAQVRIVYGGSTNPDNISVLCQQEDVCGGLPGGASLDPETFYKLIVNGLGA